MAFTISEDYLPAVLTSQPMNDEEFAELCSEHPDLLFETTAEGQLVIMPLPYTLSGVRQGKIFYQLEHWSIEDGRGVVGESNTLFVLPNGARRAPDAAWTQSGRLSKLDPKSLERYWHLCPDFVIELRSHTDRLKTVREKMREWIDNGASLGWLIDPESRQVEIYRPGTQPEILDNPSVVKGEGLLQGFELRMARVWNPLGT